jgi:ABC-type uncharacterized transport system permease subunit
MIRIENTAIITGLFKYPSIRNLTAKMNTDHILNPHIFTHPNSAIIHHFFHHLTKAVHVLMFGLSMLYSKACLHTGQNIDIHKRNIIVIAIMSQIMLNLCIAFTK